MQRMSAAFLSEPSDRLQIGFAKSEKWRDSGEIRLIRKLNNKKEVVVERCAYGVGPSGHAYTVDMGQSYLFNYKYSIEKEVDLQPLQQEEIYYNTTQKSRTHLSSEFEDKEKGRGGGIGFI